MPSSSPGKGLFCCSEDCIFELYSTLVHVFLRQLWSHAFFLCKLPEAVPVCPLVVPAWSTVEGAHWHFLVYKYDNRPMVTSPQLRENFTVAELVNVVSCKCQIRRACGSPASGEESGRFLWLTDQYQLLVGGLAFHFFSLTV